MKLPLKVLILEDIVYDAELVAYELGRAGYQVDWTRVESREEYQSSLGEGYDLIIADYSLPQFSAPLAFELLQERKLDIPFIVVSGAISEDVAVQMIKNGADDYLLKDRLARLGQAVNNALEQKRINQERRAALVALRESEERFRRLAENAQDIIYRYRLQPSPFLEYVSPAVTTMLGYTPDELYANPKMSSLLAAPEDAVFIDAMQRLVDEPRPLTLRFKHKDGRLVWVEQRFVQIANDRGELEALEVVARDVTEQTQLQRELQTLVAVSEAVRNTRDRADLITTILAQIIALLEADGAAIVLQDPISGDAVVEQAQGNMNRFNGYRAPSGQGFTSHVMQTREIYISQNVQEDPFAFRTDLLTGMSGMACAPLISNGCAFGSLMITRETGITDYEARLLIAIADLAASAIQRNNLYEKTLYHSRQMAVVSEIGQVLAETLDLNVIFKRLDDYLHELLKEINIVFISFYDEVDRKFSCAYAAVDGEAIDSSHLPPLVFEPPGFFNQSEAVHTRKTVIVNDLSFHLQDAQVLVDTQREKTVSQSGLYAPMLTHDRIIGVIQVQSFTPNRFVEEDVEPLSLIANTAAIAIENARLLADLQRSNQELVQAYDSTLEGWSRAIDLRDRETEGHSRRVAEIALRLARRLHIEGDDLANLLRGALLHDIGKIGIPDNILLKPGALTLEERAVMQRHPQYAYDLLHPIEYLKDSIDVPYCHHEKWDGSGYPRGLKGIEIPTAARVFAIADVWDALLSDRPYRPAWKRSDALAFIKSQAGIHFDPQILEVFLEMIQEEGAAA